MQLFLHLHLLQHEHLMNQSHQAGVLPLAAGTGLPALAAGVNSPFSCNEVLTPITLGTSDLQQRVQAGLKRQLMLYGQTPSAQQIEALSDIVATLTAMAGGSSPPKVFLSSLDPGMGKTTALIQFLKEVIRSSDFVDVGVVVFLSRKDEIMRLVEEAGLHTDHFAVLTSDEDCNGLSPTPVNDAQILFTTQQMLARRCKNTAFMRCDPFFYMGRVRAVRVWDETLEPGEVMALSSDDLGELLPFLRGTASTIADQVQDLQAELIRAVSGSIITLPVFEGLEILSSRSEHVASVHRTLDKLTALSGRSVRVFSGQGKQMI
ncbi:hypothetical protein, partial [Roseibium aggregatum]|uniref:hypothetical protein n=1 Tax=Roseibium aggregatum TaxID=187304 RepID=UPI001AD37296